MNRQSFLATSPQPFTPLYFFLFLPQFFTANQHTQKLGSLAAFRHPLLEVRTPVNFTTETIRNKPIMGTSMFGLMAAV